LSDEGINMYLQHILNQKNAAYRAQGLPLPTCYFFNTFFYFKLCVQPQKMQPKKHYSYENVQRWTKKVNLSAFDLIFIPIHLGNHWVLAIVNLKEKRFEYYDSLGGRGTKHLKAIRRYMCDEQQDKQWEKQFDFMSFEFYAPTNIPIQTNGIDCGVFTCLFATFKAYGLQLAFDQSDIPFFRKKLAAQTLLGGLQAQSQA